MGSFVWYMRTERRRRAAGAGAGSASGLEAAEAVGGEGQHDAGDRLYLVCFLLVLKQLFRKILKMHESMLQSEKPDNLPFNMVGG